MTCKDKASYDSTPPCMTNAYRVAFHGCWCMVKVDVINWMTNACQSTDITNAYQITFMTHSHHMTCVTDAYQMTLTTYVHQITSIVTQTPWLIHIKTALRQIENAKSTTERQTMHTQRASQHRESHHSKSYNTTHTTLQHYNTESPTIQRATTQRTQHYNITTQRAPERKALQHKTRQDKRNPLLWEMYCLLGSLLSCLVLSCLVPSAGRQRFTRGDHFDLLEKTIFLFFCFLFFYFSI